MENEKMQAFEAELEELCKKHKAALFFDYLSDGDGFWRWIVELECLKRKEGLK